jgi:YbbR domain-containing protein
MKRFLQNAVEFIRAAFTENVGLKAIALAFAIGLFVYLEGINDEQQKTVPVNVILLMPRESARRDLVTQIPATIQVTLRGSARALDRLIQTGVPPVEVDLRDGERESIVFDKNMFQFGPGIEVMIIEPNSIRLEWQDVIDRRIPVQASITGQPAKGFMVKGEPEVEPTEITVRGPTSLVEVMQFARVAPFDVSGLTEARTRRLAIDAPPNRVKYLGPQNATVRVMIARRTEIQKFRERPVEIVGLHAAVANPRTVDVNVEGPPEVVRALRPEQVVPRADLTKLPGFAENKEKRGSVDVKVTVELASAEVEVQPPIVTVKW